jgi:tetratricopeptide (TPR) repeat protein
MPGAAPWCTVRQGHGRTASRLPAGTNAAAAAAPNSGRRIAHAARASGAAAAIAVALLLGLPAAAQPADHWEGLAIEGVEAYNRGDNDTALDRFQQALAVARDFAPTDQRLINSYLNVAVAYRRIRRFDQAEIYYVDAIRLQELANDPDLIVSLDALGMVYVEQGLAGRAEQVFREAIARLEGIVGPQHPYTAIVAEHLGRTLMNLGRYEEVVEIYARVVDIRAANFGPAHRSLAPPLTRQGLAYIALSRNLDAAQVLRRALALWRAGAPAPTNELLITFEALVDVSLELGRLRDAIDYQRQVVAIRASIEGERGPEFADELLEYARLLRRAGEGGQADAVEAQAAQARERRAARP